MNWKRALLPALIAAVFALPGGALAQDALKYNAQHTRFDATGRPHELHFEVEDPPPKLLHHGKPREEMSPRAAAGDHDAFDHRAPPLAVVSRGWRLLDLAGTDASTARDTP